MINTTMNAMNNTGEASATEADISPVVILGIDHGFGNIKTAHTCFRAGVSPPSAATCWYIGADVTSSATSTRSSRPTRCGMTTTTS